MKNSRIPFFAGITLSLAAAAAAGVYLGRTNSQARIAPPAVEAKDDHGAEAADISDLDRSVDELFAAKCEHDIPHYTCDECRYELGVVKIDDAILSTEGKPGLVEAIPSGVALFTRSTRLTGEVQVSAARTVHVASPLSGVLLNSPAVAGQKVSAGDILFEIDSRDVADAKADFMLKASSLELAARTAEREALLFEKKISPEMEVQAARSRLDEAKIEFENAKLHLARLGVPPTEYPTLAEGAGEKLNGRIAVRAPRGGTVLEGHASAGEYIEAGKDLFVLSDLSEVWVWADLRDADLAAVSATGKAVAAMIEGPAGILARGRLDIVSDTVSEQTRTARARIIVPNPSGALRPGMFVTVRIAELAGRTAVAVPKTAVLADEGRTFVFVHRDGEYWIRRPVTLGQRLEDKVEIVSGLDQGQRIIADGSFLLKSDVLRSKMGAGCAD
jgi:cobalt-zinc-cadmium efflux system membrane fusion protein